MTLDKFFNAKNIAIIGVSRNPNKIGHIILRNFIDSGYNGNIFIVNPNAGSILNKTSYKKVSNINEDIDLAVIAVPAELVFDSVKDCNKKRIKNVVIVTSGFSEIGNVKEENKLKDYMNKNKMKCIGVNCLGVFDAHTKLDTLFLPRYRLKRPKEGGISFVCQSGAVGSTILDLATSQKHGFSKFISYGNATNVDESDLIEYLSKDQLTKVICVYVEAVKDGRKFMKVCSNVSKLKPIVLVKGGISEEGNKATLSHTGSLAGNAKVYSAAFKQSGIIEVKNLQEMLDAGRTFDSVMKPKGNRIQVITNGGGYGIMATDSIIENNLKMAEVGKETKKILKKVFGKNVTISNPMDLVGDATTEMYRTAISNALSDKNNDILLVIALYQTPLLTPDIVDVIIEANNLKKKPILVVSAGGEFTEVLKENLEETGVPCFTFPHQAVSAIKYLLEYHGR
ncbi:CoA-binding protein [Candidatus Woesearchaeota archaeon]|nr:CoA-binding protein [Candidatus Woesearchaeota archaeon]